MILLCICIIRRSQNSGKSEDIDLRTTFLVTSSVGRGHYIILLIRELLIENIN